MHRLQDCNKIVTCLLFLCTRMEELEEIYDRITYLRQKGVKMKEMAQCADISPSVLSALYSTVLPAYLKNKAGGEQPDEALQHALTWVNNVSKKKLLGSLSSLKSALYAINAAPRQAASAGSHNPFLQLLTHNMAESVSRITELSGIYLSYSRASGSNHMKIEPYLIAPSADGSYVEVGHNNAYGATHWGAAMTNGMNHLYLMFNENAAPAGLTLFYICLKIPMYSRPPLLKGVYVCMDYNYNPVARRILFVRQSENPARDTFMNLRGSMKTYEELTEKEQTYYAYTCQPDDIIRMCNIPSPEMTEADLLGKATRL